MRQPARRPFAAALLVAGAMLHQAAPLGAGQTASIVAAATPVRESEPILLDGRLDEAVWQAAPAVTEFAQRDPDEGGRPTFPTAVRVAYDTANLYVGITATDTDPDQIVGILTRRDEDSPSDWLRVMVDSYHDRRTAFEFAVNPVGVKQDRYRFNDQDQDDSWDAVWDVTVGRGADGWRAEFRIPFSQLRFDPRSGGTFGFAVVREIGRLKEVSTWPLLPKSAQGYVSSFGELQGLQFERALDRLELVPYAVGKIQTEPDGSGNPLIEGVDPGLEPGLDLRFAVTPALTVTGTINPDFGQVEADPAEVNLTAFETFFTERRPFFVEGSGIFRFDVDCNDGQCSGLFYSRRIGRAPQVSLDATDDAYTAGPRQTTILGAAKLTGRVGKFSVGALQAFTAEERGTIALGASRELQTVEPFTSYSVARLRREFGNQSSLGFMTTATSRQNSSDRLAETLPDRAYSGGVDWDWRVAPAYSVSGFWAGSAVQGRAAAIERLQESNVHSLQRPDAPYLTFDPGATSLNGQAGLLAVSKIAGEHVRFNSNFGFKTPGFEVNDLGFLQRADIRSMGNWLQWRHDVPNRYFRRFRVNLNQWAGWNFGGDRVFGGGNVNAHAQFQNNWETGVGINFQSTRFDDRLTRGGPGGLRPRNRSIWHYLNTDDRRRVRLGYSFFGMRDDFGSSAFNIAPSVTIRPAPAIQASLGLRYEHRLDDSQWVEKVTTDRDHFVLARLDQRTASMTARVNYTIFPNLSIQMYAEPFVSAGRYTAFKELVNGKAARYEDRFRPYSYQDDPDFNHKSLRTTNVLRWEYRPGSTLFVVWQQSREDDLDGLGTLRFGRDFGDIFGLPSTNVFLVKFAYWFNL